MSNDKPKNMGELHYWLQAQFSEMREHISGTLKTAIDEHGDDCSVKYNLAEHKRSHWKLIILAVAIPASVLAVMQILKYFIGG